jgi:hypothetical protein
LDKKRNEDKGNISDYLTISHNGEKLAKLARTFQKNKREGKVRGNVVRVRNQLSRRMGSGCTDPRFLHLGTGWR